MDKLKADKIFLLADDDADDAELFCEALQAAEENVLCYCAPNGKEALAKASELEHRTDLIFLDVNMPVMSGWDCLQKLKESEVLKNIPVLIYSTSSNSREFERAFSLGALGFFVKPTDFIELQNILKAIVSNLDLGMERLIKVVGKGHAGNLIFHV